MSSKHDGWCLRTKHGTLVSQTFDPIKQDAWMKSFDFLYSQFDWMRPFWKNWDGSIKIAKERGFTLVKVWLHNESK